MQPNILVQSVSEVSLFDAAGRPGMHAWAAVETLLRRLCKREVNTDVDLSVVHKQHFRFHSPASGACRTSSWSDSSGRRTCPGRARASPARCAGAAAASPARGCACAAGRRRRGCPRRGESGEAAEAINLGSRARGRDNEQRKAHLITADNVHNWG